MIKQSSVIWAVRLGNDLRELASFDANSRCVSAYLDGRKDQHGMNPRDAWDIHELGCLGELAVCICLGKEPKLTIDTYKAGADVGSYQVRTRRTDIYRGEKAAMIIRDDDKPAVYIHVTGFGEADKTLTAFTVRGWFDTRNQNLLPEWRKTHGAREEAWFVPEEMMGEMSMLPSEAEII